MLAPKIHRIRVENFRRIRDLGLSAVEHKFPFVDRVLEKMNWVGRPAMGVSRDKKLRRVLAARRLPHPSPSCYVQDPPAGARSTSTAAYPAQIVPSALWLV